MSITTVARLKSRLGIPPADTSEDVELGILLGQIEAACEASLGRKLAAATHTRILEGTGTPWLFLPDAPVTVFGATCAVVQGSTTLTLSAADASRTRSGMPIYAATGVPPGTTVAAVGTTTLTLSAPATLSNPALWCVLGIEVREDATGLAAGGLSEDSFGDTTVLTPGVQYVPRLDADDGVSSSGMLERLGGSWPRLRTRYSGNLAGGLIGPAPGRGNIRVVYRGGYEVIPMDIELAVMEAAALARASAKQGRLLSSESYQGYSYGYGASPLDAAAIWSGYFAGPGGRVLARYRRIAV